LVRPLRGLICRLLVRQQFGVERIAVGGFVLP
jgi:hypothetical protein